MNVAFFLRKKTLVDPSNVCYYEIIERTENSEVGNAAICIAILADLKTAEILVDRLNDQRLEGIVEGITRFAWWKDGCQYVGTSGTTLKQAIEDLYNESY